MGRVWESRREALAVAAIVWLAGFSFFEDGFYHMTAFWFAVAPLALVNLDLFFHRAGRPWRLVLVALVVWQFVCGLPAGGVRAGLADAGGVLILSVAVLAVVDTPWGWPVFRLGVFASAAVTSAWALVRFYPMSDLGLEDERLRNVLVYPIGLNAVLTGLLIGFAIVAVLGFDATRSRRAWLIRVGLVVLGFALMATQSRGAFLATAAGIAVVAWTGRRRVIADGLALLAGVLAYAAVFALTADEAEGRGLVERGTSGRLDIWRAYLGELRGVEWIVGSGEVPPLEESVLGWFVHHPHGSWVTQIVWCGLPGLILLGTFVLLAGVAGWRVRSREAAPLALLVFGVTGLLFDGGQAVSLASVPRIEPLLVLVPAVVALRLAERGVDGRGRAVDPTHRDDSSRD